MRTPGAPPPTVSVVIPAYNAADTLGEQLQALATQRVDVPWEVIVADNGSTDGTRELAASWQGRLPGLRVLDASARRGPSAARNAGAAASSADLLLFCDADDVVGDGWLAAFVDALRESVFVGGTVDYDRLRPDGGFFVSWNTAGPFVFTVEAVPGFAAIGAGNFGIRRELFLVLGGFEERLHTCEDADMSLRVQLAGHPITLCHGEYHVRVRHSLVSIARQAYGWGAGQATLRHRYAKVVAAAAAAGRGGSQGPPDSGAAEPPAPTAPSRRRSPVRRIAAALTRMVSGHWRAVLSDATWQAGHRLGVRFGSTDRSVGQIEPPADLAEILDRIRRRPWAWSEDRSAR